MTQQDDISLAKLVPKRVETLTKTWRLAGIRGLESSLTLFLFKLLQCPLPTQGRVRRLGVADGAQHGMCQLCQAEAEDPEHALFSCHLCQFEATMI